MNSIIEKIGDQTLIIRLQGELDHHTIKLLRKEISFCLVTQPIRMIVWDLKNVSFMDSSGIGLILGRMREMEPFGGQTMIVHASPTIRKIFQYAGLGPYIVTAEETLKIEEVNK
ncbi:anti-sigma factor antagonist [Chryseomicrobium palamuruense]|uniref:Anti-sigma factor antagonist n=1 Tax=Chryseomicrobium palamuruense TaxID=682973 RepID=A0ABV8UTA9_9BACL